MAQTRMAIETDRPRLLIARVPGGYDAAWLLHELPTEALSVARVIRMRFTGSEGPLECLKPALEVLNGAPRRKP